MLPSALLPKESLRQRGKGARRFLIGQTAGEGVFDL